MKQPRILTRPVAVALLAAALWGSGFAQITRTPTGYRFRAKYVKGDVRSYKMTSTVGSSAGSQGIASPFTMKVLSVDKGVAKIRYTAGPMYVAGKPIGKKDTFEASLNERGEAVEAGGPITQFGQVSFPENPIRVGQVWTTSVDAAVGRMPIHVDGQFKLVGFRRVAGRRVAWITTKIKNSKSYPTSGSGTIALDVSDASLVSSHMDMVMTLATTKSAKAAGQSGKYRVKVVIVRR